MVFDWDEEKSAELKKNPRRGFGFDEIEEVFSNAHFVDQKDDDPEQYLAVGWVRGILITVIFEHRMTPTQIEYVHLVTYWRSTRQERSLYEKFAK